MIRRGGWMVGLWACSKGFSLLSMEVVRERLKPLLRTAQRLHTLRFQVADDAHDHADHFRIASVNRFHGFVGWL